MLTIASIRLLVQRISTLDRARSRSSAMSRALTACQNSISARRNTAQSTAVIRARKESRGSLLLVEYCRAAAKLSISSINKHMKASSSFSNMASIFLNKELTSLPLSLKNLLKSEWASNSTSLQTGYFRQRRLDNCCARARHRLVFPVPLGP